MKEFVIYKKNSGMVMGKYDKLQTLKNIFPDEDLEQVNKLVGSLYSDNIPHNFRDYKILKGEFVPLNDCEKKEISRFGNILSEEERLLNALNPSYEEIKKAETTIEILTLLSEVL